MISTEEEARRRRRTETEHTHLRIVFETQSTVTFFRSTLKQSLELSLKQSPSIRRIEGDLFNRSMLAVDSESSILYTYTAAYHGFAASLDPDQEESLRQTVSVVGVLDTGVWPESKSFDDSGMPDVPSRWMGECESAPDFKSSLCNKKLIGARRFSKGYQMASGSDPTPKPKEIDSPRDSDGHGTHTSSTAAGSQVANASLLASKTVGSVWEDWVGFRW